MAFNPSLLVEEEEPKNGFDLSLLEEESEQPSKLEQANADLAELGQVLEARKIEQGPTIGPSERSSLQRLRTSALGRAIAGPTREERAAMVAQQPSVADIAKTAIRFTTAPPQITEPIQEATEPVISQLAPVPAGITRGVRDVAIGALGSLPAGALMPARLVAAPFAADYASTIPEQFQAIRESETPEQAAQALTTTGLGGALTIAGTAQALRSPERIAIEPQDAPVIERTPDADPIRVAEEVLPDVPASTLQGAQEVPAKTSAERVPASERQAPQSEVLLAPETKPPAPVSIDPTPSGQALGIVPPGSGKLMEIIDKAIGKPKEAGPSVITQTDTPLPDFQEHGSSKKIFSQPFGFENLPVIGALFGGTRRLKGHVNESLSTYWAERQIGRSIASAFGSEHSWLDKPFTIQDGQITNIIPAKEGASRYISDVFEALQKDPNAYVLNAEQRKAFNAVQKLEKDFSKLEDKYKIGKEVDDEITNPAELLDDVDTPRQKGPYFPRIVTTRPEGVTSGLTRGASVGAKAFFEKPRMFDTEAEGWARGYKYEPSIVNRLATRTERLYKRIADKRLASDPSLEGIGRKEVESQLKASFAEELTDGSMTEKRIAQMADSIEARGRVYAPAFFNKIFPEETAAQLNKAFPKSQSSLRQAAASINNALKGVQLGLDLGVGFIQGQALLARHPAIWGKAQLNSLQALFHKEQFPNYVRDNVEPIRELAQLGSGVGRLEEYMAGLGGQELLGKVPVVKTGVKAFGRQFQTFLDVAKVEMWKAFRETTPREQWADVVQTIESTLSSSRMEGAGVSQNRALAERALLLAPSYYRGGLNMIAAMAEKGVSGQIARRAMVAYGTAGAVLYYGVAKQLGMSDEDIAQRMNPARSDFMLWRIKTKNRISNVGFGGFYRSLLRLMGNTAKTSLEHPENWVSLSPAKNPITKWYRGHAGPVVTATWDAFSGKDYMGEDTDIASIARRAITPITLQSARGKPGQPTPTAAESAGSFVGLQSFPATSKSELNKIHSEWLATNKDPKIKADFERNQGKPKERSRYAELNTALIDKDQKAAVKAIKDLQAEGVKRADIFKRMSPYTASGESQKPLFHESASMEAKFRKSLTPEQKKLYDEARADRKEQWKLFLKAYRENK